MYYKLVAINSIEQFQFTSWTLNLPATIGRNPEHAVAINHDSISRTHCKLSLNADGALSVHDLNSLNGIYVNDRKVKHSVLIPGDVLQVGAISFRVNYDSDTDHGRPKTRTQATDMSSTVPMKFTREELRAQAELNRKSNPPQPPKKWWQFW